MTLSAAAKAAFYAESSGEALLAFITITHAQLATPIRLVNNTQDVVVGDNTFLSYPLQVTPPAQSEDLETEMQIIFGNVTREDLFFKLLEIDREDDFPLVTVQLALASSPTTIEREWLGCLLSEIEVEDLFITAHLRFESVLDESLGKNFERSTHPGLFDDV